MRIIRTSTSVPGMSLYPTSTTYYNDAQLNLKTDLLQPPFLIDKAGGWENRSTRVVLLSSITPKLRYLDTRGGPASTEEPALSSVHSDVLVARCLLCPKPREDRTGATSSSVGLIQILSVIVVVPLHTAVRTRIQTASQTPVSGGNLHFVIAQE